MNIVFWFLVIAMTILIWFLLVFTFKPLGNLIYKIFSDAKKTITNKEDKTNEFR